MHQPHHQQRVCRQGKTVANYECMSCAVMFLCSFDASLIVDILHGFYGNDVTSVTLIFAPCLLPLLVVYMIWNSHSAYVLLNNTMCYWLHDLVFSLVIQSSLRHSVSLHSSDPCNGCHLCFAFFYAWCAALAAVSTYFLLPFYPIRELGGIYPPLYSCGLQRTLIVRTLCTGNCAKTEITQRKEGHWVRVVTQGVYIALFFFLSTS